LICGNSDLTSDYDVSKGYNLFYGGKDTKNTHFMWDYRKESMYISDGFVHGESTEMPVRVASLKALDDMMMIIEFEGGQKRLFDASELKGEVFDVLKNVDIFMSPRIEHGVVTWNDGAVDVSPEYMYEHSYEYPETDVV